MRFDLKRACKLCPFANTPTRIRFRGIDRATEIEEHAYRNGFVCHEHGESVETDDGDAPGIDFRADGSSQHCFGALAMHMKNGNGTVPFEWKNQNGKLGERWWKRVSMKDVDVIFDSEEEFIEANRDVELDGPAPKPKRKRRRA